MKRILIVLIFLPFLSIGQTDTTVIFKRVNFKGYTLRNNFYYLEDILATDSLRTNIKGLSVVKYRCSTICGGALDWEEASNSAFLSEKAKHYIKLCFWDSSKLYIEDIWVADKSGKRYMLSSKILVLKRRPTNL